MDPFRLLRLHLAAPLAYIRFDPSAPDPAFAGELEGIECHEPAILIAASPDDGPRVPGPLPEPRWRGRAAAPGENGGLVLAAGDYLFMQWRPADAEELRAGIEWFVREAWWEGATGKGPLHIRRLVEDGKPATQALWPT